MTGSIILISIVAVLSYLAASTSQSMYDDGKMHWNIFMYLLLLFLILFCGLRTTFNDTSTYMQSFIYADFFEDFIAEAENLNIFRNPAFYMFQSFVRTYTNNPSIFLMILSIVVNVLNLKFIVKHVKSVDFTLSMIIYSALLLLFTISAQKQAVAMAILTLGIDQLIEKHYIRFFIIVFIAGLFHTYAWLYAVLPLLRTKPWGFRTFVLLGLTLFIVLTFQSSFESFLEVADSIGKGIDERMVLGSVGMNKYRIAVYAVLPVMSFIFKHRLNEDINDDMSVLVQMSIYGFMYIILASINGANMFGRAAMYLNYGVICALPYVIRKVYTVQTAKTLLTIAGICFVLFYFAGNGNLSKEYRYKSLGQFINEVMHPTPVTDY